MCFFLQFMNLLAIMQLLDVLNQWLQVELNLELEARDHWRHIVELFQLVLEVLVDEWIVNLLLFHLLQHVLN